MVMDRFRYNLLECLSNASSIRKSISDFFMRFPTGLNWQPNQKIGDLG
jgi:hypothetical protein